MRNSRIAVIDYGVGNLYSVRRALEHCGASDVVVSSNPEDIAVADRVVLPGVGAFADGMRGLAARDLIKPINEFAGSGRPLLGICLGMQMLATESEEFVLTPGLDLIPGRVVPIPRENDEGAHRKIPFIGWAPLVSGSISWNGSVLDGIPNGAAVYLVHSYFVRAESSEYVLAEYDYQGLMVTAAIRRGNVTGVQFHPEKSGDVGLSIIKNFLEQ